MGVVLSIRGTSGSGKTSVARRFLPAPITGGPKGGPVDLNAYPAPTKRDPARLLRVTGYVRESTQLGRIGVCGPYHNACGGMDQLGSFEICRGAILHLLQELDCKFVIAEGLLASGVYGSWGEFSALLRAQGHAFAFCYLQTPLDVCKTRVKARQAEAGKPDKEINWGNLDAKYEQVISNREKALAAGELVYDLPYGREVEAVIDIMSGQGEKYRGHS